MKPMTARATSTNARPFEIRAATSDDMDQLCDLAGQMLTQIHAEGTATDARRVFERAMNSSEVGIVLVAVHKSGLCGYAYGAFEWRAEFGGETMDIIAIFVNQQWRSKGVGRSLVSTLLENARERGVRRVSVEVHPGNSAIERTLESFGFDPERRTLWGLRI